MQRGETDCAWWLVGGKPSVWWCEPSASEQNVVVVGLNDFCHTVKYCDINNIPKKMQIIGLVYLALNSCFHIVIFWGFKLGLTYSTPPGKTGTTSKSWTSRAYFCCLHISSCCHKYPLTTLLAHLVGFFAACPFFALRLSTGQISRMLIFCLPTRAGNLFKFCCRSSTEYQVAVLD